MFRINKIMAWSENSLLILVISFAFYTTVPIHTPKTLIVPSGSISSIISQLNKKGYDVGIIDKTLLRFMPKIKSRQIYLGEEKFNRIDFLYTLTSAEAMIHKVQLIPGETSFIFFKNIAKQLDLNSTKIHNIYKKISSYPEAGIYADTYHVPYGIKEKNLITFLLRTSHKKYKQLSQKYYKDYNQTQWHKILTIASIIQKEAASIEEMPFISSVIYNRLSKKMKLQMDGTLNYGKYSHIKITSKRIKTDTSTFNTYKHKGLPSSPVCAVNSHSIKAAINPEKTNYLYFMRNKQGVHDFTNTYKKHRKNIKKAR